MKEPRPWTLPLYQPKPRQSWRFSLLALALVLVGCGRGAPLNVLLVTLDTTRADHLGSYGYSLARTKNIDQLASEGVLCTNAISAAPITLPSHSTIMTGLYPPAHGVRDNGSYALGDDAITLADRLAGAGYDTRAFVSALVLNRRYNLSKGFAGYDDDLWSERRPAMFMIRSRPGPKTAENVAAWIGDWARAKKRKPFFVWMHLFDAHQPYTVPAAERILFPTPYDAEIAVLDRSIGIVLDELRTDHVLDNTLVIVTADHGESLGEHQEKTHGLFIYNATVRVPLILRAPKILPRAETYTGPVRSVDIVPTVLAALHLPGGETTQGENLLPAFRGDVPPPDLPQYTESLLTHIDFGMSELYGIKHGAWKWIRAPQREVYDLAHDPRETHNLYTREGRRGAALDRELEAILADSRRRALAPQRRQVDPETARQLEALGYLSPSGEQTTLAGVDPKTAIGVINQLEDARHLAQKKKWPETEAAVRPVLQQMPTSTSALGLLALARLHQGAFDDAREIYLRMLKLDPHDGRVYGMMGALSLAEGDLDTAERNYRQALAINPASIEALTSLGMIAALRDDDKEAERWLQKASAIDPSYPIASRRLGDIHYERGDFSGALPLYERSLSKEPDFATAVQAGNCARRLGALDQAEKFFHRAARLQPDSWIPTYNLACLKAQEHEEAASLALLATMKGFVKVHLIQQDRDLEAVRRLPGFAPLLKRFHKERHDQRVNARREATEDDDDAEQSKSPPH
jgi:choline-sulfatase